MEVKIAHYGRKSIPQYKCPKCKRYHFETNENPFCDDYCKSEFDGELKEEREIKGFIQKVPMSWKRFSQRFRIRKSVREKVFERDNYTCVYCWRKLGEDILRLVIDHFEPYSHNQNDNIENLVTCCVDCNGIKSDYHFKNVIDGRDFLYAYSIKFRKYAKEIKEDYFKEDNPCEHKKLRFFDIENTENKNKPFFIYKCYKCKKTFKEIFNFS